jgi:hypothetical protein
VKERTGQNRTGQVRTGQDRTGQERGQDRKGDRPLLVRKLTAQDKIQDEILQVKGKKGRTGPDRIDRTGQDRIGHETRGHCWWGC